MTDFFKSKVIPFLWRWEGTKFENDPDDPGGATKYGIDQRSHPNVKIKDLTEDQAIEIYWSEWLKYGCDHLPYPMNWVFFDTAVNMGVGRANQFLKESVGDANKYLDRRIMKYHSIADHNPTLRKFLKGWIARAEDLRKAIA